MAVGVRILGYTKAKLYMYGIAGEEWVVMEKHKRA